MAVPRRLPPTPEERQRIVVDRMAGGSRQGSTRMARPVAAPLAAGPPRAAVAPGGVEVGDTTGQTASTAISATTGVGPNSTATAAGATAVGFGSEATASEATAIGAYATATGASSVQVGDGTTDGVNAVGIGTSTHVHGADAVGIGYNVNNPSTGTYATAVGGYTLVEDPYTSAFGYNANATGAGSMALGCDSTGNGATTSGAVNEIALGTLSHATIIDGALVLRDSSNNHWKVVVSTGGVLSTVAYP